MTNWTAQIVLFGGINHDCPDKSEDKKKQQIIKLGQNN